MELTKISLLIPLAIVLSALYVFLVARNKFEVGLFLLFVASFGQILRGANGAVMYIAFILFLVFAFKGEKVSKNIVYGNLILVFLNCLFLYSGDGDILDYFVGSISLMSLVSCFYWFGDNKNKDWISYTNLLGYVVIANFMAIIGDYFGLSSSFLLSSNVLMESDFGGLNSYGTFGSSELMGEFHLIVFIIMSFQLSTYHDFLLRRTRFLYKLAKVLAGLLVVLSFSRTLIVVLVLVLLFQRRNNLIKTLFILFPSLGLFLALVPTFTSSLVEKFGDGLFFLGMLANPLRATGTSREIVFEIARQKIGNQRLLFGEGYATPNHNRYVWLGNEIENWADYHNLYFSLIPIFGWVLFSVFMFFIIKSVFKNLYSRSPLGSLGFVVLLLLSLLEWKINGLRTGGYAFIYLSFFILFNPKIYDSFVVSETKN